MTYNPITYTASGGQTVFNIPFTRISDTYIRVATKLVGATTYITKSVSTDYTIVGNTVVFNIGLASGVKVRIWRSTNRTSLVDFNGVNNLTSSNLGLTTTQQSNIAEEVEASLDDLNAVVDGIVTSVVGFDPDNVSNTYLELQGDVAAAVADLEDATTSFAAQTAQVTTNTTNITTNTTNITNLTNQGTLPNGYVTTPTPTYTSARVVNFNGIAAARTVDNVSNIVLASSSRNLDLGTTGANGLDTGTIANNTWYYVYLYQNGYVASTTNGASTLTIDTVVQKVVQLPLTLRTNGSANILPFYMVSWEGRSSHTRYSTQLNGSTAGLAGSPTVIGLVSSGTYSAFSLASFVPPSSRVGTLFVYSRGGGAVLFRQTGATNEYIYDIAGAVQSRELTVLTNSSQSIDARVTISGVDLAVTGYTINL